MGETFQVLDNSSVQLRLRPDIALPYRCCWSLHAMQQRLLGAQRQRLPSHALGTKGSGVEASHRFSETHGTVRASSASPEIARSSKPTCTMAGARGFVEAPRGRSVPGAFASMDSMYTGGIVSECAFRVTTTASWPTPTIRRCACFRWSIRRFRSS